MARRWCSAEHQVARQRSLHRHLSSLQIADFKFQLQMMSVLAEAAHENEDKTISLVTVWRICF
jgi:hypothetical protein